MGIVNQEEKEFPIPHVQTFAVHQVKIDIEVIHGEPGSGKLSESSW